MDGLMVYVRLYSSRTLDSVIPMHNYCIPANFHLSSSLNGLYRKCHGKVTTTCLFRNFSPVHELCGAGKPTNEMDLNVNVLKHLVEVLSFYYCVFVDNCCWCCCTSRSNIYALPIESDNIKSIVRSIVRLSSYACYWTALLYIVPCVMFKTHKCTYTPAIYGCFFFASAVGVVFVEWSDPCM